MVSPWVSKDAQLEYPSFGFQFVLVPSFCSPTQPTIGEFGLTARPPHDDIRLDITMHERDSFTKRAFRNVVENFVKFKAAAK
jgi:hypothetical protein